VFGALIIVKEQAELQLSNQVFSDDQEFKSSQKA